MNALRRWLDSLFARRPEPEPESDRRSGGDRRSGAERRTSFSEPPLEDRRTGEERRSGLDRRD
jgi:hypothetical protein